MALTTGGAPEPQMFRSWTTRHWDILRSEGLGPWFYKSLADCVESAVDPDTLALLQQDYKFSAISCLGRENSLKRILGVFNDSGIPVALLKGAYLAHVVYKDPALRPMADTDLLVREEDFELAGHELGNLGFKPAFRLNPDEGRFFRLPVVYGNPVRFPQLIDLHRGIQAMDYYYLPSISVWNEAVESHLWGHRVSYFSVELNFIHLALHNLNHRGTLRDWLDLVIMVRSMNLDWDRLILLARSMGVMRPLFWVCRQLQVNWKTPVPQEVSVTLGSYAPHRLEDRIIRSRISYFWRLTAKVARHKGWNSRLRYLAAKLAPPRDGSDKRHLWNYATYWKSKVGLFHRLWKGL